MLCTCRLTGWDRKCNAEMLNGGRGMLSFMDNKNWLIAGPFLSKLQTVQLNAAEYTIGLVPCYALKALAGSMQKGEYD